MVRESSHSITCHYKLLIRVADSLYYHSLNNWFCPKTKPDLADFKLQNSSQLDPLGVLHLASTTAHWILNLWPQNSRRARLATVSSSPAPSSEASNTASQLSLTIAAQVSSPQAPPTALVWAFKSFNHLLKVNKSWTRVESKTELLWILQFLCFTNLQDLSSF